MVFGFPGASVCEQLGLLSSLLLCSPVELGLPQSEGHLQSLRVAVLVDKRDNVAWVEGFGMVFLGSRKHPKKEGSWLGLPQEIDVLGPWQQLGK